MSGDADDDVQNWFEGLSFKLKKELAGKIKDEADKLAAAIKDAAPRDTGALANSVQVRRKKDTLEFEVTAGGDATTKEVRAGSGVFLDYARFIEFGAQAHPAEPFFYNTAREMAPEIQQNIADAVEDAISKS